MIKPYALPFKGTIGITALSSQVDANATANYISLVEEMGFKVYVGKTITNVFDNGYTAATPEMRGVELNEMLKSPDIDAIVAAAGGYGAQEVVPYIDMELVASVRKPIMGFSDTTFLLNAITSSTGLITFLGPTGEIYGSKDDDKIFIEYAIGMLTGSFEYPMAVKNFTNKIIRRLVPNKDAREGTLIGGNLAMTECLIGTPWCLKGKIDRPLLLVEDVGEGSYNIARMFLHLLQAGYVDSESAGIIVGDFVNLAAEEVNTEYISVPSVYEVLRSYVSTINIPSLVGYDFSHGDAILTWPIGAKALIDGDARAVILTEEPVVPRD